MKKYIILAFSILVVISIMFFIFKSFRRSSAPPLAAGETDISALPARVYGVTEPAGREVFVSPSITRYVTDVYVKAGDSVKEGQRLCDLESSVEKSEVELAMAKVSLSQKSLELSIDELNRTKALYKTKIDSEYKYVQAKIQKEVELKRLKVANNELDVSRAKFDQTVLRAPVDGIVYKFDVRLGETLTAGDNSLIVMGAKGLWVCLSVESFWKDKVNEGAECKVYDSETQEYIGEGRVISRVPYMGRRNFRTEDLQERFDTKFQEAFAELKPARENIPIGLSVFAEF